MMCGGLTIKLSNDRVIFKLILSKDLSMRQAEIQNAIWTVQKLITKKEGRVIRRRRFVGHVPPYLGPNLAFSIVKLLRPEGSAERSLLLLRM